MTKDGDYNMEGKIFYVEGCESPVHAKVNRRAQRLILRIDPHARGVSLTLPNWGCLKEGLRFCARRKDWVNKNLSDLLPPIPFLPGNVIPVLNKPHLIKSCSHTMNEVRCRNGLIIVSVETENIPNFIRNWFELKALRTTTEWAETFSKSIGKNIGRVQVRDTRSCWGSCSRNGNLTFCWRIIFAPLPIVKYLVAHEVAHLIYRNHSAKFWSTVEMLDGNFVESRSWLRKNGTSLYRYGQGINADS